MKRVGIVITKENSKRFPKKHIHNVDGKPLFWYAVEPLLNCEHIDDVYVLTNSVYIKNYCIEKNNKIKILDRLENITDDEPLFNLIKFSYRMIPTSYTTIIHVQGNSIGHTSNDISNAIKVLEDNKLKEVRSYDTNGIENGIIVFEHGYLLEKKEISTYVGNINSSAKEIHYKEDLNSGN